MTRLKFGAVALTTLALAACSEEPLDLTGTGAATGERAISDVAEAGGGGGSDAAALAPTPAVLKTDSSPTRMNSTLSFLVKLSS